MQTQLEAIVQRYTDKPHLFGGAPVEQSNDVSISFTSDASEQKKLFVDDQMHVEQLAGTHRPILEEDAEESSQS